VKKMLEQRALLRKKFAENADNNDSITDTKQMTAADAQFVGRLTDLVYSLMSRQQVDIETVASHMKVTTSHLRRKITALTGQTPAAYIMKIRLSNAKRLLDKHPDMPISEVAYRCGFSDQAHFSHAFQKAFNISPSQWQKRAKQ